MDIAGLLPLFIAGLAVIGLAAALILTVRANYLTGRRFRRQLAERVNRLRLGRMLARRGIDVQEYLHRVPVVRLEQEARACEGCDQTATCDRTLARATSAAALDFCPNDRAFGVYAGDEGAQKIH